MLTLRPNCEYCDKDLPPGARDAMICTYECTFCAACVETKLKNVCPNCGGGFEKRPIRPKTARRPGVSLVHQPASTERIHMKWDKDAVAAFADTHKDTPPSER
ncbi:MAG: DUF1272 domain-containing protein [Pseudomonadota bacterium]